MDTLDGLQKGDRVVVEIEAEIRYAGEYSADITLLNLPDHVYISKGKHGGFPASKIVRKVEKPIIVGALVRFRNDITGGAFTVKHIMEGKAWIKRTSGDIHIVTDLSNLVLS